MKSSSITKHKFTIRNSIVKCDFLYEPKMLITEMVTCYD